MLGKLIIDKRKGAGGKGESVETGDSQKGDVYDPLSSHLRGRNRKYGLLLEEGPGTDDRNSPKRVDEDVP